MRPGSREAPRNRPTLGRHASLRGKRRETRIALGSARQQPQGLLAGRGGPPAVPTYAPATGMTMTSSTAYVAASSATRRGPPSGAPMTHRRAHRVEQAAVRGRQLDCLGLLDQALRRRAADRCAAPASRAAAAAPGARPPPASARRTTLTVRNVRGSAQLGRGPEGGAVERERLGRAPAREVVGEDVGQPLLGGQPGGVVRGAEQPDRRDRRRAGVALRAWVRPWTARPTPPGSIIAITLSTYSGKCATASSVTPPRRGAAPSS